MSSTSNKKETIKKSPKKKSNSFFIYGLIGSSILISIILAINNVPISEAKKLIKLKDLKKAKKYGYLLATQRKKFYAIPVPFPLPVIVKRQQIYTQVPVIPRYVQAPTQHHQTSYMPQIYTPPAQINYDPYDAYASMSGQQYVSQSSADYQTQTPYIRYPRMMTKYGMPTGRGRYFSTLASALGQAYPVLGSTQGGNVVGKILSGQAKVLPPSQIKSLLFSSKGGPFKVSGKDQSSSNDNDDVTSGTKTLKESSSSSSNNSTTSSSKDQDKPSASEAIYSAIQSPFEPAYREHLYKPHHLPTSYYRVPRYHPAWNPSMLQAPAAYQQARIIPTYIAPPPPPPSVTYPTNPSPINHHHSQPTATNVALAAEMMQQLMSAAAVAAASTQSSVDISAESSNLGQQQVELMQPQESNEVNSIIDNKTSNESLLNKDKKVAEAVAAVALENRLKREAIKAALVRHRLAEAQLAEANSIALAVHQMRLQRQQTNDPASVAHHLRLMNYTGSD